MRLEGAHTTRGGRPIGNADTSGAFVYLSRGFAPDSTKGLSPLGTFIF